MKVQRQKVLHIRLVVSYTQLYHFSSSAIVYLHHSYCCCKIQFWVRREISELWNLTTKQHMQARPKSWHWLIPNWKRYLADRVGAATLHTVEGLPAMVAGLPAMVADRLLMEEDLHPAAETHRPMATHLMRLITDPMVQAPAHPIAGTQATASSQRPLPITLALPPPAAIVVVATNSSLTVNSHL